jgi:hypothetical protein
MQEHSKMPIQDAQGTSADRWSSWRRGATVSVTPADTRLYRVVTDGTERIIGLGTTQLALIGARASARDSAGDLLAFLGRTGFLRAWEYRVAGNDLEAWCAEPVRELSLFARRTASIEPFDPRTHLRHAGNTA